MHAKRTVSLILSFLLIFAGIYLEWNDLVKSGWMWGLIVSETALFSMFLLLIGGNKKLPNDTDFVAIVIFAMPTLPLILGGNPLGIISSIMIIAGLFNIYKQTQRELQKSDVRVRSVLTLALILSEGYLLLREGMRPLISALFIISLMVGIAVIVEYIRALRVKSSTGATREGDGQ